MDNYTHMVYTRPLQLKLEAVEAFRIFKVVAETESGKKLLEVLTDNAREFPGRNMLDL